MCESFGRARRGVFGQIIGIWPIIIAKTALWIRKNSAIKPVQKSICVKLVLTSEKKQEAGNSWVVEFAYLPIPDVAYFTIHHKPAVRPP